MWKQEKTIEEDVKQAFFKVLIIAVPEGSILAVSGLYYGSIPEEKIEEHFKKVDVSSWSYSHLAEANYFATLSSNRKNALSEFIDQEPNLNYELTHFFVLYEGELIFESYDNFAIKNFYSNLFQDSDLNYFRSKGMSIEVNAK